MKESIYRGDKRIIFSEAFTDEQSVRRNGGVPTAVTFSNGVATFNNSLNSNVRYNKGLNGTYSIRIRLSFTEVVYPRYIFDGRGTSGIGSVYPANTNNTILSSSGTKYVDGISTDSIGTNTKEIVISGITITGDFFVIGGNREANSTHSGTIELFEIYEGTLSANEVSNLYNNSKNKSLPPYRSGITETLNIDGKNGTISNKYGTTIVNTDVAIVRSGSVNAMRFNGNTSKLDCGSYDTLVGDRTFIVRVKLISYGGGASGRIFENQKLILLRGIGNKYSFYSNAISPSYSADGVIILGIFHQLIITRTSTGITNLYINGVLSGEANQSGGTPVDGVTNLFIGNRLAGDRGLDGLISGVRIVSGIFSVDEISQIYTSEKQFYNV